MRAVEANAIEVGGFNLVAPKAKHLNTEQTKEQLISVLFEGEPTPQLQAAIFDALAELPGIKAYLDSDRRIAFNADGIFRHYPELDGA